MHDQAHAAVVAAATLEVLYGQQLRLHWVVDLRDRNAGRRLSPADPICHEGAGRHDPEWDQMLQRLKHALDNQPFRGSIECQFALTAAHITASSGTPVRTTWAMGWRCNVAHFMRLPPQVGRWLLWPDSYDLAGVDGDQSLPMWWNDDIPF